MTTKQTIKARGFHQMKYPYQTSRTTAQILINKGIVMLVVQLPMYIEI